MIEELKKIGDGKICPVVAILKEGRLLIGLRHYTPDKWKSISVWTIPGGRTEVGEFIESSLLRETFEEVGIDDLQIDDFLGIVPGSKEGDIVYIFTGTTNQEPRLMEPEKFSEWKWEKLVKIPDNFINQDALKIIKGHFKIR